MHDQPSLAWPDRGHWVGRKKGLVQFKSLNCLDMLHHNNGPHALKLGYNRLH